MKKIFISLLLVSVCSYTLNAQLVISPSGNVGIGLPDTTMQPLSQLSVGQTGLVRAGVYVNVPSINDSPYENWYTIYSKVNAKATPKWNYSYYGVAEGSSSSDRLVGVCGIADRQNVASSGRSYGVWGEAGKSTSGWNYGVCGFLNSGQEYGAGIFGGITHYSTECYVPGRYAGFFNGQTRVNGDFYATTVNTTSDARLKTNITNVNTEITTKIQALHPVQFTWRPIEDRHTADTASVKMMYFGENTEYDRSHYGFLAQDVQRIFPELVHEDGDGYLSVNYVEMIPLLVHAIQELSEKVEMLESATQFKAPTCIGNNAQEMEPIQTILYQNTPNPFSEDTKIEYQLPLSTLNATLYVYDLNGLQVAEYPVSSFGEGSVIVSAGSLAAGMYLYSLIVDEQVVDTKRMILTK